MNDTIYREDAIKAIEDKRCWLTLASQHGDMGRVLWDEYYIKFKDAVEALLLISSADRPKGRWIAVDSFDAFGGDEATWMAHGNPIAFHYCSECGEHAYVDEFGEEILSNYCSDCGAKMSVSDDDYDYERAVEMVEYERLYEPTYNPEDGSM